MLLTWKPLMVVEVLVSFGTLHDTSCQNRHLRPVEDSKTAKEIFYRGMFARFFHGSVVNTPGDLQTEAQLAHLLVFELLVNNGIFPPNIIATPQLLGTTDGGCFTQESHIPHALESLPGNWEGHYGYE